MRIFYPPAKTDSTEQNESTTTNTTTEVTAEGTGSAALGNAASVAEFAATSQTAGSLEKLSTLASELKRVRYLHLDWYEKFEILAELLDDFSD